MFCFIVTALEAQPAGFSSGWIALPSLLLGICFYQDCYRACKTSRALIFLAGSGGSNLGPADCGKADGTKAQGQGGSQSFRDITRTELHEVWGERHLSSHPSWAPHSSAIGPLNVSTHVGASVTLFIQWGCGRGGNELALLRTYYVPGTEMDVLLSFNPSASLDCCES